MRSRGHLAAAPLVAVCLVLGLAGEARGQAPQSRAWTGYGFFDLNVAGQAGSSDFSDRIVIPRDEEATTITIDQGFGGGPMFDVRGGARVWRNLAVGLGISRVSDTSDGTVNASIPHPLVFDQFRNASTTVGLDHSELAVHLQFSWLVPVTDAIDVAAFAGPSWFKVTQDVVTDAPFQEGPPPFTSVTLQAPVIRELDPGWATGGHLGVDVIYKLTPLLGVGGFLRFAGASVDLDLPGGGTASVDAGGFQGGAGLRVRF